MHASVSITVVTFSAQCIRLSLGNNSIGDEGMTAFADACAKGALASLKTLSLRSNSIGDAGMTALASALGNGALDNIQSIYLGGNPGNSALVNDALRERKL